MWHRGERCAGRQAFTLVEVLIVVTIIAILAGLVFPHYMNVSEKTRAGALMTDLQQIRRQLMIYRAEHRDQYPLLAQMWGNLTGATDINGNAGPGFGPYLDEAPINPFTNGSVCAADNSADWQYDDALGTIHGVVPANAIAELGLSPSDVVAAP